MSRVKISDESIAGDLGIISVNNGFVIQTTGPSYPEFVASSPEHLSVLILQWAKAQKETHKE